MVEKGQVFWSKFPMYLHTCKAVLVNETQLSLTCYLYALPWDELDILYAVSNDFKKLLSEKNVYLKI